MADDTYEASTNATFLGTVLNDDGTGIDTLSLTGTYSQPSTITLKFTSAGGTATSARVSIFDSPNPSRTLTVSGFIENVRGSDSADDIIGNEGANRLEGDQIFDGIGGNDTISGADGDDTIIGGAGNDSLSGGGDNDVISGGAGNDFISGGFGVDLVFGGAGADSLSGGGHVGDTVSYSDSDAAVRIDLTYGVSTFGIGGDAQNDTIDGFSDVLGSEFDDIISDTVSGTVAFGGNDNTFYGRGGNDELNLGGGADLGYGGTSDDTIFGGVGNDFLDGGTDDDQLFGGAGVDSLVGDDGIDLIEGGAGADTMFGGGQLGDSVSYIGSGAGVRINLTYNQKTLGIGGDAQGDGMLGFSGVIGSDFGDVMTDNNSATIASQANSNLFFGRGGNDRLNLGGSDDYGGGGNGTDTLIGGLGADELFGGGGGDRFVFAKASESTVATAGRDTIADFNRAAGDKIDLRQIDAQSGIANQSFDFIGTSGFTGDKGDLRYIKSGANILVLGDINGDKRADFSIMIEDAIRISGSDFLL